MKNRKIVFLRHGESQWNLENRFTGWTDVNLTMKGRSQAKLSGEKLKKGGFSFNLVYTSVLKRARETMKICLRNMGLSDITIVNDWRLNERHYGALQGLSKADTTQKYGKKQVLIWRRSYATSPPKLDIHDSRHPRFEKKYNNLKPHQLPTSESLKDTTNRVLPLWNKIISPNIDSGNLILIVAHGNSIRALIKHIDKISDEKIIDINIPTGIPLIYEFDNELNAIKNYYLQ
tara:strand:- start:1858 stop:2553 length:696 start_codon:yes stop_codon:yes gene_type:complete